MERIKASVIGLRGHASSHINLLRKNPGVDLYKVYYHQVPPPGYGDLPLTDKISDCFPSDLIILSTPTASHINYLRKLSDYEGYIFLEKPAVNSQEHILELQRLSDSLKCRIKVNFNFNHHPLAILFTDLIQGGQLGKVFSFDVHTSHGVAHRKDWDNTWRVDNQTGLGPLETTGIHYIQFSLRKFGDCVGCHVFTECLSGRPSAIDTGLVSMVMAGGTWVRIRHSYATPYAVRFELWGTDGYLVYDGNVANLHHPRDTFDGNNQFTNPPIKESWKIDFREAWLESLSNSQKDILGVVARGELLDCSEFDRDVSAMGVLLNNPANLRAAAQ